MATRKLEPVKWAGYFDHISAQMRSSRAEIRVSGLDIGSQIEADKLILTSISYDAHARVLTIGSERLAHRIDQPSEIYVQEEGGRLSSFEVVDADGRRQLIELTPMLTLPPPG